jgi:hypothetical protein
MLPPKKVVLQSKQPSERSVRLLGMFIAKRGVK